MKAERDGNRNENRNENRNGGRSARRRKALLTVLLAGGMALLSGGAVQAAETGSVQIPMPGYVVEQWSAPRVMTASQKAEVYAMPEETAERMGSFGNAEQMVVWGITSHGWYLVQYHDTLGYVKGGQVIPASAADLLAIRAAEEAQAQQQALLAAQQKAAEEAQAQQQALLAAQQQAAAEAMLQAAQQTAEQNTPAVAAGVVFIGDSRFVQMREAAGANTCSWIAENSRGYDWFKETAIPRADKLIGNGTRVLINLGVNDTRNADQYIPLVNAKAAEWTARGAKVYYASVNPVWNNPHVTQEQVDTFNQKLMAGLYPQLVTWLDSSSWLRLAGFYLVDGLHYDEPTYQKLYQYYLMSIA